MISFGYWLRRQRKALDLTQQTLADRVGCSLAAIKKIEQDERRPSRQIAELLADALDVPASQREMFLDVARGLRPVDQLLPQREGATASGIRHQQLFLHNLPLQLSSFIGREREIAEVIRLFENTRLITLTGPGGTGKTRFAIQVANQLLIQYPDGLWLVELAPLNDLSHIPQTIASVFELREAPNISLMDTLINYLRAKQLLLILDNCEHLVGACARIADTLLHACPNIRILATSRESLGIAGETLYLVLSLSRPDIRNLASLEALHQYEAIKLFIDRASTALPTFTLTDGNASSIVQICQNLDGIPLAIELAASKIRALSVQQIAQRLDDRFRLLTGGNRTALPRHQTLQAAIDWSYNLLSPAEQVLIRRLSVLVGGWTLEAAESICSDTSVNQDDVLGLLVHLINKSMIILEDARYRMLETIRQYANEKLFESREAEQIRDRHLEFHLRFAKDAEPKLRTGEQVIWLERIETENDNLRAALAWSLESGKGDHALQLAGALSYFWELGSSREGYKWLDAALMLTEGRQNETVEQALSRAKALYAAGRLHFVASFEPSDGRIKVENSLLIARQMGDRWLVTVTLEHLGWMAVLEGDIETAYAHLEEGISLARDLKDPWPLAACLLRLASPLMRTDASRATQSAKEGLILARNLGDSELLSYGLIQLAGAYFMLTNFVEAALAAEEALERAHEIGSGYTAMSLFFLAVISSLRGHSSKAESFCSRLCDQARETKYAFQIGIALIALAWVTNQRGQAALSARLLAASDAQFHRLGIELDMYGGPIFIAYKQALAKAEAQLGPEVFQVALEEGGAMTIEQAIALATEDQREA